MSAEEVICLSSSDDDKEDKNASAKTLNKRTATASKKAQKRQLSIAVVDSDNAKKRQIEKKPFPNQAGCSNDDVDQKKKKVIKPLLVVKTKIPVPAPNEDVFQSFLKTCLERRNDKDTKQVLSKLEKQYSKLMAVEKNDDEFRLFISNCHDKIVHGLSSDIYTPILDLYTETKRRVDLSKATKQQQTTVNTQDAMLEEIHVSKEDAKKIKQLEGAISECLQKIKKLEEKEVDFDDDNDSVYIQEDKYKKRLIRLCNVLSKISGDKILRKQILKKKIRRKDIPGEMTGISSVDEAILNFVNSDIGKINQLRHLETQRCADHVKMPEYLDILKCIEKCNKDSNLDLSKEKMSKLAKRAFQTVGNFLKKKRMDETQFYIQSLLDDASQDPAKKDVQLNRKLQENKKEGDKRLEEIFKKYVDKQEGLTQDDLLISSEHGSNSSNSSSSESDVENYHSSDQNSKSSQEESRQQQQVDDKNSKLDSSSSSRWKDETDKKNSSAIETTNLLESFGKNDDSETNTSQTKNTVALANCSENETSINDKEIANKNDDDGDVLVVSDSCNDLCDDDDRTSTRAQDPLDIDTTSSSQMTAVTAIQTDAECDESLHVNNIDVSDAKKAQPVNSHKAKLLATTPAKTAASSQRKIDAASKENTEVRKSFIKVCAFAKPPPAWGQLDSSSPEKVRKKPLPPPPPPTECIDLTKERENKTPTSRHNQQLPSTRSINPLANIKRTSPVKRVVIVKNVINNYNVPLSAAVNQNSESNANKRSRNGDGNQVSRSPWLSKDKTAVNKRPYIK